MNPEADNGIGLHKASGTLKNLSLKSTIFFLFVISYAILLDYVWLSLVNLVYMKGCDEDETTLISNA